MNDLKYSARMFVQSPGFTIAAVGALGLGIAANTAIFSVVNTVLLKPFGYRDPERIVMFQNVTPTGRSGSASPTEFNWWRAQTRLFQDVSAYDFGVANLTGESAPEQVPIMHTSADFFRLCGADAVLGRTFSAADDVPNAPKTAVLAYAFWQRHFGGDPQAAGRRMTLNGERYEIIGVAGLRDGQIAEQSLLSGDIEISEPPDVYVPFQLDPYSSDHGHYFNVAGRLRDGITLAAAEAEIRSSYTEFARRWPGIDFPGRGFGVQSLQRAIVGGARNSLLILLGAVGLVLLIACANVANLLLARATGRKREIAIRTAVGATRGRIVRQLLTECLMLSLASGVVGLAAGYAAIRVILKLSPGIPRIGAGGVNVDLDGQVLGFTLALSILTGILFGLVPALQASGADLTRSLKERGATTPLLAAAETALAVVLLIGAALLIRTFIAIRQVDPGFVARNVLTMRIALTGPELANDEGVARVIQGGVRRIRALPGVEAAAASCCVPLVRLLQLGFEIVGRPEGPTSGGIVGAALVSAGYFETFRIPVLRGRLFTERDETGPPVVIVNQTLAKRFWPDGDPLNDRMQLGENSAQIVGVVGDVRDRGLNRDPRPTLYMPSVTPGAVLQSDPWTWVVRTRENSGSLSAAIEKELREASGGLPVAGVRTMEQIMARSTAAGDFNTLVMTIFGCSALLLAAIGVYGLMAYSVAQRVQEIGIRVALGAEPGEIRRMVVFQGLRPALAGIVCGIAAAFGLTHLLAGLLFGVKPWDPVVFSAVPIVLVGVALSSVWIPAMRAGRIDPIRALRHE